jgi:hypothetical protein
MLYSPNSATPKSLKDRFHGFDAVAHHSISGSLQSRMGDCNSLQTVPNARLALALRRSNDLYWLRIYPFSVFDNSLVMTKRSILRKHMSKLRELDIVLRQFDLLVRSLDFLVRGLVIGNCIDPALLHDPLHIHVLPHVILPDFKLGRGKCGEICVVKALLGDVEEEEALSCELRDCLLYGSWSSVCVPLIPKSASCFWHHDLISGKGDLTPSRTVLIMT